MVLEQTSQILDNSQVLQKIQRIAYQIYENNFEEQQLLLAGIQDNGYLLAELLAQKLQEISPLQVSLISISLNKQQPLRHPVTLQPENPDMAGKVLILVDDVLNTGKTLAYSLHTFLAYEVKKIEIATLIDRHHTLFPVSATYTGYSLATTLNEHVKVVLKEEGRFGAYLV
jgi:pyrimidine operon attenuation protein / uracil phosphoribosyltransferase